MKRPGEIVKVVHDDGHKEIEHEEAAEEDEGDEEGEGDVGAAGLVRLQQLPYIGAHNSYCIAYTGLLLATSGQGCGSGSAWIRILFHPGSRREIF